MFQLNGKNCIEPGILKLSLQEPGFSIWWEKYSPNYFRHQCGVDPGEGYLLVKGADVPSDTFSVPLTIGPITIPKVVVLRSVELEAASNAVSASASGTRLVKVADIRHYLKRTQVKKNYNVIRYFDVSGNEVFDQSTMKDLGGDSYTNWTWETLINDLWDNSLLGLETLNLDDATFPELFPHNYYFETWSHRDALAQVLLDLGFTLEPGTGSTWRIVPINTDSTYLSTVNGFKTKLIQSNNITDGLGEQLPAKLIFHFLFPEESPAGKENRSYRYEHTVSAQHSYQSILSNSHDSIISPLQAAFDFTNPTEPINKIDLDLFASTVANSLIKMLYTDDGHDKTFGGFLNTFPSADIGRVTWKDTGSNVTGNGTGATTRLEHCFPVAKPPKIQRPSVPIQKVSGNPSSNVTPEMSTFQLVNLKLISGIKPEEPLTVNNTYGRSIASSARVDSEYSYEDREWNTPEIGSGSGGSDPAIALIRFELAQDKTLDDATANAFAISLTNIPLYSIVLLDREHRRFVGFAERTDPQFGYQHGARGWAQFTQAGIYDIVTMESSARWISGETYGDISPDAVSFQGKVFEYWGAFPNSRAPVMEQIEETSETFSNVIRVYDDNNLITSSISKGSKYQAVYDEGRNRYILTAISTEENAPIEKFALLIADIPKANYIFDDLDSYCEHGYADQAAIVFEKQREDPGNDESPHQLQAVAKYPVVNCFWPEIIKAGTTNNEDKPVIARGYLTEWDFGDDITQTVFVITNLVYPLTIISGTSVAAVTGSGDITVTSINLLWGRNPIVDGSPASIASANPEGWEGPAGALVYAMQIVDGTWLTLYLTCPSA